MGKQQVCGSCGKEGHNSRTCGKEHFVKVKYLRVKRPCSKVYLELAKIKSIENAPFDFEKLREKILELTKDIGKDERKGINNGSFIELLFPSEKSNQSYSIRVATVIHKVVKALLESEVDLESDLHKWSGAEGSQIKEVDFFRHILTGNGLQAIHCEFKSNLSLDAGKKVSVTNRNSDIIRWWAGSKYDAPLTSVLVSFRYSTGEETKRIGQYSIPILGYTEFFEIFGVNVGKESWESLLREVGQNIKNNEKFAESPRL